MAVIDPLSDQEKAQARIVWRILENKWGKERAMTSTQIIKEVARITNGEVKLTGPRIRKMINFFRSQGYMSDLVSGGGSIGYYRTRDRNEIIKYVKTLAERINSMAYVKNTMIKANGINEYEVNKGVQQINFK